MQNNVVRFYFCLEKNPLNKRIIQVKGSTSHKSILTLEPRTWKQCLLGLNLLLLVLIFEPVKLLYNILYCKETTIQIKKYYNWVVFELYKVNYTKLDTCLGPS